MDPEQAAQADRIFTRVILADLMAEQCMLAHDPIAEAMERRADHFAGADKVLDAGGDDLNHLLLARFENFWDTVLASVRAKLRGPE